MSESAGPAIWLFEVGLLAGLGESVVRCCAGADGVVAILEMTFIRLRKVDLVKVALWWRTNYDLLLVNIVGCITIAVVIEIDLDQGLRILA